MKYHKKYSNEHEKNKFMENLAMYVLAISMGIFPVKYEC
jgi:hypothetical protein